jgi:hypothetical protein
MSTFAGNELTHLVTPPHIEVTGLTNADGGIAAVRVSFTVARGELVGGRR